MLEEVYKKLEDDDKEILREGFEAEVAVFVVYEKYLIGVNQVPEGVEIIEEYDNGWWIGYHIDR